ncbi:chromosome partitioning protein ParB [bacterium]|nr:chromosome partitioning protein ParB [bacterium]
MQEIEIGKIDRRWEGIRLPNEQQEQTLLSSICAGGIREPLQGVMSGETLLLLDGFKRLRCCQKLSLQIAPVVSLGVDEASGMLALLRQSNIRRLNILEQAALVDELKARYHLSVVEIARQLERSPAWVSVRLGILSHISESVREAIFSGKFPARAYLYTLRSFTRVNKIPQTEINHFVQAVSGKQLSLRQIDILAHGYFRGGTALKTQIQQGQISWTLEQMQKSQARETSTLNQQEKRVLLELEMAQKYIHRLLAGLPAAGLRSNDFFAEADLIVERILRVLPHLKKSLETVHDSRR